MTDKPSEDRQYQRESLWLLSRFRLDNKCFFSGPYPIIEDLYGKMVPSYYDIGVEILISREFQREKMITQMYEEFP